MVDGSSAEKNPQRTKDSGARMNEIHPSLLKRGDFILKCSRELIADSYPKPGCVVLALNFCDSICCHGHCTFLKQSGEVFTESDHSAWSPDIRFTVIQNE